MENLKIVEILNLELYMFLGKMYELYAYIYICMYVRMLAGREAWVSVWLSVFGMYESPCMYACIYVWVHTDISVCK